MYRVGLVSLRFHREVTVQKFHRRCRSVGSLFRRRRSTARQEQAGTTERYKIRIQTYDQLIIIYIRSGHNTRNKSAHNDNSHDANGNFCGIIDSQFLSFYL